MGKGNNFSTHYNSIVNKKERTELRNNIIAKTGISYGGFRCWIKGIYGVPTIYQSTIAEIMGTEVSELFPTENNNSEVTLKK